MLPALEKKYSLDLCQPPTPPKLFPASVFSVPKHIFFGIFLPRSDCFLNIFPPLEPHSVLFISFLFLLPKQSPAIRKKVCHLPPRPPALLPAARLAVFFEGFSNFVLRSDDVVTINLQMIGVGKFFPRTTEFLGIRQLLFSKILDF